MAGAGASGNIHPTAIVDPAAELDPSVRVGSVCDHRRRRADRRRLDRGRACGDRGSGPHRLATTASIRSARSAASRRTRSTPASGPRLEIGDDNTFREYVTINRGTAQDVGVTRVGDDNWIMAYVHIAHDCQVGSHTILANTVNLAGHVVDRRLGDPWRLHRRAPVLQDRRPRHDRRGHASCCRTSPPT